MARVHTVVPEADHTVEANLRRRLAARDRRDVTRSRVSSEVKKDEKKLPMRMLV